MTYLSVENAAALGSRDWEWKPWRRVARIRREANRLSNQHLLALSADRGVVPRPDDGGRQLPTDETIANYWIVHRHDIVFNPMWAFQGGVAVSELDGAVSTAYRIYTPSKSLYPRFVHYFLRSRPAIEQFALLIRGVTTFDRSVTREDFEGMPVPVPPMAEQRAIADFLDRETARIDALIAKKRQLSAALTKRWTTEVDRAFSHDPGLPFKRLLRRPLAYGVLVPVFLEGGVPMLRINDFANGPPDLTAVARIDGLLSQEYRRTIVEEGDLVVSVVGTLGRSAEIGPRLVGANLNRPLARVQLRKEVPRSLVRHWFGSSQFQRDAQLATSSDSAQPTLGLGDLKNFRVRIPEDKAEWGRIATQLEEREELFSAAGSRLATQMNLLQEHREALITAAVSGQMKAATAA